MNWDALAKLTPLLPHIERMIATVRRLENDPDVQDAIKTAEQVGTILTAPSQAPADH